MKRHSEDEPLEVAARAEANKYIISLVDDFNLTSPLNSVEVVSFIP